jgi:predicted pyridoxine 5'-phosphate oxidase superfamily flavin-nucleotide-binding protein
MDTHGIDTLAGLRDIYGPLPANSLAMRIVFPQLHRHHRAFIALSPFLVIASADRRGVPDVSPRGDLPGFVAVLDDRTLVIPDRPGNKKLLTMTNVLENPAISLIFFVPGRTESLRVNGRAQITITCRLRQAATKRAGRCRRIRLAPLRPGAYPFPVVGARCLCCCRCSADARLDDRRGDLRHRCQ